MKILEKMLEVETEAKLIIENAQLEANEIRKKAREDAKQLVIDGRKNLQDRLHQEIVKIEEEATTRKKAILQEAEAHLAEIERTARERMDNAVDNVITTLFKNLCPPTS